MSVFSDFSDPKGFLMITGVTFATFSSGFGVCMFNLDTIGECVAVANGWVDTFLGLGNHAIEWGKETFQAVFAATK